MEEKEELEENSSMVLDEIEEINSNRSIFRKYPELYEDEWANI
jgi:hypothetical protein